jgi:hypothetical protein
MDTAHPLTDTERHFLGCLMWLPLTPARRLLAGMCGDDVADPMAAFVLRLAIEVVATDAPPAPVALFTHAVSTGQVIGEQRQAWLGGWLRETYGAVTLPILGERLKIAVLEAAWRRALTIHARRLTQAAEGSSADIARDISTDTAALDALWSRYRAATDTGRPAVGHLGVAA